MIEGYNEEDASTQRLLNAVCEGIEIPSDEEIEEVKCLQGGVHVVDENPYVDPQFRKTGE